MLSNKCSIVKTLRKIGLLADFAGQTDAEHGFEVMARVDLEGDVSSRPDNARDLGQPVGHHLGDLLVVLDSHHYHEVELTGHRVGFGDAPDISKRRTETGNGSAFRLDQNDGGDHGRAQYIGLQDRRVQP